MLIIRPVETSDIEQLLLLAQKVAPGITTFPPNREVLEQKIVDSQKGFTENPSIDSSDDYLMVLEDTSSEVPIIMGTAAVYANIGKEIPFYTFKIIKRTQYSYELGTKVTSNSIHLVNEYVGDTEIGTLVLDPDHRGGGYGKLLAKCRYMLIAQFKERFGKRIFAELRGWSDDNFISPFWESVGKYFFNGISYEHADYLSATTNNQFIADLMPVNPIYLDLLPENAQAVVGKPHPTGEPALKMLFAEGFRYDEYVDIFDAGPTVHVPTDDMHTIKNSRLSLVEAITDTKITGNKSLVCNTSLNNFRVCLTEVNINNTGITISENLAKAMQVEQGEQLRVCPLDTQYSPDHLEQN
ncbi:MAG: arginine N-succinyltransferase [Gammaproteobacteria bacterium]|nr:arginine N-succinyltransferase [Gammaproteobacteria bacterium]